ncbi:MAG: alkaline phosphatase D family protein [Verrucomicrobiota bacterium]
MSTLQFTIMNEITGPFLGHVTDRTAKIWIQCGEPSSLFARSLWVTIHPESVTSPSRGPSERMELDPITLNAGSLTIQNLEPDTLYFYRLWKDESATQPLDLQGLELDDLRLKTFPRNGYEKQLDFLIMSCHNPFTSLEDGEEGFAVWGQISRVIEENKNVRFVILAGDQIYGDEIEAKVKKEKDPQIRLRLYLFLYKKFWNHLSYRKILSRLPAMMMWDDHDITDGWGSREDSFKDEKSSEFSSHWSALFQTAKEAFTVMQASRNPDPLDQKEGFDFCFKVGRAGFCLMDLRSHRNVRLPRITTEKQRALVKSWVAQHRNEIDTFFFVSTVVFSHGAPLIEDWVLKYWFYFLDFLKLLKKIKFLKGWTKSLSDRVGDLRDDINDSWGAEVNAGEADEILEFLFDLQNSKTEKPVHVVILSGDIHTPGYATLYSSDKGHLQRATIPHITATPVSYKPFSWIGEAVYRHLTQSIKLGRKGVFSSQVSHHYCSRNVVLLSLRDFQNGESQLKVKYYLEGYPEPQIMLFDLNRSSHREAISWSHPKRTGSQMLPQG